MTTETILTEFHIDNIAAGLHGSRATPRELDFARVIEQAVLQSPEIEALRKDSERYQWLRNGGNDDIGVVMGFDCIDIGSTGVVGTFEEILDGEHLDVAIDAAMEQQK